MALTDSKARSAKPQEKDYKLSDEKGLFLLVAKSGHKRWRLKYRLDGKEKLLAIGVYPDISLAQAREQRDRARALLAQGVDPMAKRKADKAARQEAAANSFEVIAKEFLEKRGKKSRTGDARLKRILEYDLCPHLGARPIGEITASELLQALRRVEARGALATAHKAKQAAGQVFRYAIATGRADRDPSADLRGALQATATKHHASITDPKQLGKLLAAIHEYQGSPAVMAALKIMPLIFCRPGELRRLEWGEINFEEARVEIPGEKMKSGHPHIIPLSAQAIEILREVEQYTGRGQYVFPNARSLSRPQSENALRTALRTLGYTNDQMTPHGFRATARTLLEEVLNFPVEWVEHQLAHTVKDANGRAYNRTKHIDNRRKMMQAWADYLDSLRLGVDNVVPITAAKK